jgi:N-acyl-D-aspartate/D-glutamate deacylase
MSDPIIGIRYVVVAVGGPQDPATDEDVETMKAMIEKALPITCTVLSERVSNRLTWALIDEGAMSS